MGDQDHHTLFQPLITSTAAAAAVATLQNDDVLVFVEGGKAKDSTAGIVFRLLLIFSIGILSIWATYESSKGFDITVTNQLARDSTAGQRFHLFYVSDDKATRIVLNATRFVENLLYDDDVSVSDHPKKPVSHVTLRLVAGGLNSAGEVAAYPSFDEEHGFVIDVSSKVMEAVDVDHAVVSAILRGMARVWLWDGESKAPLELLSGVVEYIVAAAGYGSDVESYGSAAELLGCGGGVWYEDKDPRVVARFLDYFEKQDKGFIPRLNRAMKDRWHDRTVDDELGKPAKEYLCRISNNYSSK